MRPQTLRDPRAGSGATGRGCSSVNRDLRIAPSIQGSNLSRLAWSETSGSRSIPGGSSSRFRSSALHHRPVLAGPVGSFVVRPSPAQVKAAPPDGKGAIVFDVGWLERDWPMKPVHLRARWRWTRGQARRRMGDGEVSAAFAARRAAAVVAKVWRAPTLAAKGSDRQLRPPYHSPSRAAIA